MNAVPDPVPELDELTITIVVDNATDTLSSIDPGIPQLPELAYLLVGIPPIGQHDGHDCVVGFDHLCVACHGFSALATARLSDQTATVLFDVGPYADVWLANAERIAVDLSSIDVLRAQNRTVSGPGYEVYMSMTSVAVLAIFSVRRPLCIDERWRGGEGLRLP